MKPIKGLDGPEVPREPNPVASAIGKATYKIFEYVLGALTFAGVCACVAFVIMYGLHVMHEQEPAVPPFGFLFLWAATWTSGVLALFAGNLVKMVTADVE